MRSMEGMEMANHCHTERPAGLAEGYRFTPLVAEGGREVVVDREAGAHPWDIGGGFEPL